MNGSAFISSPTADSLGFLKAATTHSSVHFLSPQIFLGLLSTAKSSSSLLQALTPWVYGTPPSPFQDPLLSIQCILRRKRGENGQSALLNWQSIYPMFLEPLV